MAQNNYQKTGKYFDQNNYKEFYQTSPNKFSPNKNKEKLEATEGTQQIKAERSLSFNEASDIGNKQKFQFRTSGYLSDKDVGKRPFTFYEEQLEDELKQMHKYSDANQLTLFEKMFRPIKKGSLRGSVFSLTTSAIGTGCLSLPKAMSFVGVCLGTFLIISMAIFQSYCM